MFSHRTFKTASIRSTPSFLLWNSVLNHVAPLWNTCKQISAFRLVVLTLDLNLWFQRTTPFAFCRCTLTFHWKFGGRQIHHVFPLLFPPHELWHSFVATFSGAPNKLNVVRCSGTVQVRQGCAGVTYKNIYIPRSVSRHRKKEKKKTLPENIFMEKNNK